MRNKFLKSIACTLALSTVILIGGNVKPVNAQTIPKNATVIQTNVTNLRDSVQRVSRTITITESGITFDKNKASLEGFTSQEIENLSSTYNEINGMIKTNKASVFKTSNGNYDVKINNNTPSRSVTSRWYGWDFEFSAGQCADAAAICAGGAAVAGAAAGILGLTGHIPAAIALTVATGVLGLGSAYLWYCSNRNGLTASYNYITGFSCSRND